MLFKKTVTLKKGGGIGKNDSEDEGGGRWKLKWRNIQSDTVLSKIIKKINIVVQN